MSSTVFLQGWFWPFAATALVLVALFTFSLARAGRRAADAGAVGDGREGAPRGQAFAFAVGLPLLALALYAALGQPRALNPAERETGSVEQVEGMVERLAARLKRDPGDAKGWLMLAHSYKVMGRAAESAEAYEQADRAAPDTVAAPAAGAAASVAGPAGLIAAGQPWQRDPNRLVDWIEVRMLAADDHFDARSLQLLRRAQALAPQHPGVLMLAGLAALDQRDFKSAQAAFTALRDQAAPGSDDRAVLDDALAKLAHGEDPRRAAAPAAAASAR
jgi:cytochrome c-type biogenesis protein CcmH